MKVRFIAERQFLRLAGSFRARNDDERTWLDLTDGAIYGGLAVSVFEGDVFVCLLGDGRIPLWVPVQLFDVVDGAIPGDWQLQRFDDEPQAVIGPSFITASHEDFVDTVDLLPEKVRLLREYQSELVCKGYLQRIVGLLERHAENLPDETRDAVEYHLAQDDYAIALEELCLDLMRRDLLTDEDVEECVDLGRALGLDEKTVLSYDLWRLLMKRHRSN